MRVQAHIDAGACGFGTVVDATCADGVMVTLAIESACPSVSALAAELQTIHALNELLRHPLVETSVARLAARHGLHASCLVPVGILKAVEAAAGLALPSRSCTTLTKEP
jgi:hypothetical protein